MLCSIKYILWALTLQNSLSPFECRRLLTPPPNLFFIFLAVRYAPTSPLDLNKTLNCVGTESLGVQFGKPFQPTQKPAAIPAGRYSLPAYFR